MLSNIREPVLQFFQIFGFFFGIDTLVRIKSLRIFYTALECFNGFADQIGFCITEFYLHSSYCSSSKWKFKDWLFIRIKLAYELVVKNVCYIVNSLKYEVVKYKYFIAIPFQCIRSLVAFLHFWYYFGASGH